ncbi:hypothetical protein [Kitasatospora viridis]|uniref:Uncharacterized protein n=1 Tax=Kitasatospora viridis TaxID=281105 RepID=A0A561UE49_9ACTN|nr:hypothetical protein [Kitasatospora viridis]TWF97637.1 hypothetical protein FHX73_111423 [Kitasatospora viridis]
MHRATEGAGRIGPRDRRRGAAPSKRAARLRLLGPLGVLLWLVLGYALVPGPAFGGSSTLFALLTLGGWGLGVLPVHSDSRARGSARRSAAQPQPARGRVEAGRLQQGAEG